MSNQQDPQFIDACPFNPAGVICRDKTKDCASCGWFPAEAKRRKLNRLADQGEKGGRET